MNTRQRKARRKRIELESRSHLNDADHRFIAGHCALDPKKANRAGNVLTKLEAKTAKKRARHMTEHARWQPGFKGEVAATGREFAPGDYEGRIRVHDGAYNLSARAWLRKGVR